MRRLHPRRPARLPGLRGSPPRPPAPCRDVEPPPPPTSLCPHFPTARAPCAAGWASGRPPGPGWEPSRGMAAAARLAMGRTRAGGSPIAAASPSGWAHSAGGSGPPGPATRGRTHAAAAAAPPAPPRATGPALEPGPDPDAVGRPGYRPDNAPFRAGSAIRRAGCLNVYIRERHKCASCPWMDVPHRKEAVLISALVRRSRLGYPQRSHIAMISEYACAMWRRDTSLGTAQATARGRAEALLNRDASNVKMPLCAVMTLYES